MRIGIDVGGTNTDAVATSGGRLLAKAKAPTTQDVTGGVVDALRQVLLASGKDAKSVECVMIGTTHFTNALVEQSGLMEVGVIRIGAPASLSLPPFVGWPEDLARLLGAHVFILRGGYNLDGREIAAFDEQAAGLAAEEIARRGLRAVAISCIYSPIKSDMEIKCSEIVRNIIPDAFITISNEIGRIGFLERENATILNSSLRSLSTEVIGAFGRAMSALGVTAPFYISQNDGTPIMASRAAAFPVFTIASGPTNSMRGAAFLTGLKDAIVVDIGGTTTDVGAVCGGFPRESSISVDIGGVRTNFRMPDILAIAVGGGSLVRDAGPTGLSLGGRIAIGPDSVGFRITQDALVFGGGTLTLTDLAVAGGLMQVGDPKKVEHLDPAYVAQGLEEAQLRISDAIDRMKTSADPAQVVVVGGGSALFSAPIGERDSIAIPDESAVANAVGAALGQVSGEVEKIYAFDEIGRDAALAEATDEARRLAHEAGARHNIQVIDIEEVPLAYLSQGAVRVRVKAVGELSRSYQNGDEIAPLEVL